MGKHKVGFAFGVLYCLLTGSVQPVLSGSPAPQQPDQLLTEPNLVPWSTAKHPSLVLPDHQTPVRVNLEVLKAYPTTLHAYTGKEIVAIDQFSIELRPSGMSWFGKVQGHPESTAVFTLVDDALYGHLDVDGRTYSLEWHNGVYAWTDTTDFPTGSLTGDALRPPVLSPSAQLAEAPPVELASDDGTQIDLMVLYTQQLSDAYGTQLPGLIQGYVDVANAGYMNSGVATRLRLVYSQLYDHAGLRESTPICGDSGRALETLTSDPTVAALRDTHGADLVTLLRQFQSGSFCGCGWLMTSPSSGFSVLAFSVVEVRPIWDANPFYCQDTTLAHELGHNMGCEHDRNHAGGQGAYSYSYGYDQPGLFATIMSYADQPRITFFSTPLVTYGGVPIGKPEGDPDSADNARTINNTRTIVAQFRAEVSGGVGGTEPLVTSSSTSAFVFSPNADGIDDGLTLNFNLADNDLITFEILDHAGNVVRHILIHQSLAAGPHTYSWDGLTDLASHANDGMYRYRIYGDRASVVEGVFGLNNTVPQVSRSWYLAEGSTVGFEAYVLVQNPNAVPTNVNVTFFRQDGTTKTYAETVSARTRTTVAIHGEVPGTYSVSTQVEADLPIIVERAMYFVKNGRAGHDSTGSTQTSTSWYFPANRTFSGDEDFILITNPSTSTATVAVTYYLDDQAKVEQVHTVYPTSRYTVPVHAYFAGRRVSVRLVSDLPVASERAFYFGGRTGGSAGIGAVSPSLTWYFAEGDTINTSYLEMFNPSSLAANVTINFLREDGTVIPHSFVLAAERRLTVDASTVLGAGVRFSAEIVSTQPIVAERMVFTAQDCGDSIGSPTPDFVWNLAEGFTAFGYQTWVVISNPGTASAQVTARLMLQSGDNIVETYTLGPKTRRTVYLNDVVLAHFPGSPGTSVSTQVTSDQPIVVERTMKFDNGRGMHQAMGVRQ